MPRILIADVDKNLGVVLKQELEDVGLAADLIRDMLPAPKPSDGDSYAVVILGMLVPSLNVFRRLQAIKKKYPAAQIVFFSESASPDETASLIDAGADVCFARDEIDKLKLHLQHYLASDVGASDGDHPDQSCNSACNCKGAERREYRQ